MCVALRITILLCCLLLPLNKALEPDDKLPYWYKQEVLQKNILIRILRRDFKPHGPSAKTDEVLDEYKWGVNTAYDGLRKSKPTYDEVLIKDAEKQFQNPNYNRDQETIVVLHPIYSSADSTFVKNVVIALAMRNLHKKYNIFAVDMGWDNPQMIFSIWRLVIGKQPYFDPTAKAVSQFLVTGVDGGYLSPDKIHLAGWSYSAQFVGYIARYINDRYKTKIASIISLDPFSNSMHDTFTHVSYQDARVVHIFHSNSLMAGTRERVGTADFVYNDGMIQPECKWPHIIHARIKLPNTCSHMKAVQRLWYLILFPSKFIGRKCPSWNHLVDCRCEGQQTVEMTYPFKEDSQAQGIYYLRTLETKPYGLGKWGVSCSSEQMLFKLFEEENLQPERKPDGNLPSNPSESVSESIPVVVLPLSPSQSPSEPNTVDEHLTPADTTNESSGDFVPISRVPIS